MIPALQISSPSRLRLVTPGLGPMIRFAYRPPPDSRWEFQRPVGRIFTDEFRQAFTRRGFVRDDRHPDVLFCCLPSQEVLAAQTPVVVCAREPSCDFTNSLLTDGSFWSDDPSTLLESRAFLGVFKERRFRDSSFLAGPRLGGRWHNNILLEDYRRLGKPDVSVERFLRETKTHEYSLPQKRLYERASHVLWDFFFSPMNRLCDTLSRPVWRALAGRHRTRVLDVFCSLALHRNLSRFPLISWHRQQCLDTLGQLTHLRYKGGVRLTHSRQYLAHLLATRISVSPWGGGAWCLRDMESILAGCVTIKPPCPWVDMAGFEEIYSPDAGYFVPCRSDFQDLPDVIGCVLADYPTYFERAQRARRRLLSLRDSSRLVDRLTSETRRLLEHRTPAGYGGRPLDVLPEDSLPSQVSACRIPSSANVGLE